MRKRCSNTARRLRAVFLKLTTAMDMRLMRLEQANSAQLTRVTYFYRFNIKKNVV